MRNLLAFLWKHHFFIFFVILEIICIILIARNSYYQRASIVRTANMVTGSLYNITGSVKEYFSLRKINEDLLRENVMLRNQMDAVMQRSDSVVSYIKEDSLSQGYRYIPARVISNTTGKRNNYIMLNRGVAHGVTTDAAVIAPDGIVGIVVQTSARYSLVMSVLHKDSRISARIKKSNQLGTLIWEGIRYREGTLVDVPAHVDLAIGDTVVTSGFSHIFPDAVPIGVISDYEADEGNNFYTITVDFSVDYNRLSTVEIVLNLSKEELEALKNAMVNE